MSNYKRADFYSYDTQEGLFIDDVKINEDAFNVLLHDLITLKTKECEERILSGADIIKKYEKDVIF